MKTVKTTCPYCGVGCGVKATLNSDRAITVEGDNAHPANEGKLCSKGTWLAETVGLEGRLLHPEIEGKQVSWDEATNDVAARLKSVLETDGPEAVAFYVSGQLLTEDYYAANKLIKGFIGTANIDTNSRLCMASAVAAHNRAFGEDIVPCSYQDLDCVDLILLVGSNTAWCHPVIWQRIEQTRKRRGTKLVVIDPRKTETAALADLHIPVAPDGDTPLFNAVLAACRDMGLLDQQFIADHCQMPDGFLDGLDADAHGIDPKLFAKLMTMVRENPRMITLFSQGANQSVCGTDKGNAIINLHLATGRISRLGAGPFSITGQPNAMGGREVGGLANTLACHLGFSSEELASVGTFWNAPNMCTTPGLKADDLFRAVYDGKIKFLWVMATNPAVSMSHAGLVREALEKCPNLIVSDVIAGTDTQQHANVCLPAMGWAEKDGTVTNSERRVSRQRGFMSPPGEARADWRILSDVAAKLGFGDHFAFEKPADVFREYAAMTQLAQDFGKQLDLTTYAKISDADYDTMKPFQWGGEHPCKSGFSTPTGKANLIPVSSGPAQDLMDTELPLRLNTGRYRDQWHTMTRTGLSAKLSKHRREPLLEVHPNDAASFGLTDEALANVTTSSGESIFRVTFSEGQREGEIFVPMHWTDMMSGSGRTGLLMAAGTDPISGQPGFKNILANMAAYKPDWRAFMLTRQAQAPDCPYWVRARIEGGYLTELAGNGSVDMEALLPAGQRSEVRDMARGMVRSAVTADDGSLEAMLFITRSGQLPARDWVEKQFASQDGTLPELLAGRPGTPQKDAGPTLCVCHDVGENTVREAVECGSASIKAVGDTTCAGTNCGSCRPLIAEIIKASQPKTLEAAE